MSVVGVELVSNHVVQELSLSRHATRIHEVMQEAYTVEAHLLGVQDFHPLGRTVRDIIDSNNRFIGVFQGDELIGVCELERVSDGAVLIASTVVKPAYFRTGVASSLLAYVLGDDALEEVHVCTAQGNAPALDLYRKHGFVVCGSEVLEDGMVIVKLRVMPHTDRA